MQDTAAPDRLPEYLNFKAVLQARATARALNLQPASARHVLEVIAGYTNGDPARPGYQRLADDTGLGVPQVRRLIAALIAAGYLTLSRRRPERERPGWGQPQWALGPLCNVSSTAHFNGKVSATAQLERAEARTQSEPTSALQSEPRRAQKRDSVDHGDSVVPVKRVSEEKGAAPATTRPIRPAPKPSGPAPVGNPRVAEMIDALRDVKLPDKLTPQERTALLGSDLPCAEIAAAMLAINERKLGDQWDRDHLTINQGIKLHRSWKARQQAPRPAPNGTTGAILRWANNRKHQEETAHADDRRAVRGALPPPRPGV